MSVTTQSDGLLPFIERAAKDPTFDVAKLEALLRLRREERQEMARQEYFAAMSRCQAIMEPVIRGNANPGTQSRYARLEDIDGQMRPIYTADGFSVTYGSDQAPQPGWIRVTCTVAHVAGHSETHYLDGPTASVSRAMTQIQGIGSAVTYLRRYLLSLVFNIVQADIAGEDMDGEEGRREDMRAVAAEKAAALAMQRAERIQDKSKVYDTAEPTDADKWWFNLETKLATAQSQAEIMKIGELKSVKTARASTVPGVQERIMELLANAYARFPTDAKTWTPDLSDEALGEVQIEGAEKVGAG